MVYSYEPPLRPIKSQRQENVPTHTFTPRTFQVELLDTALHQNTIACLATDAGKTFISALLIKELAHQVRDSAVEEDLRPCWTVFMVNSVSMAEQQAQLLRLHTDLEVGIYLDVDLARQRDAHYWQHELAAHQLLMVLPSVALHLLGQGHLKLPAINLLVFDECHLVMVAEHPYAAVMEMYHSCLDDQRPRILGLTASILQATSSSPEQLEKTLNDLEQAMCSMAETATDLIVTDLFGARPLEVFLNCDDYTDPTDMGDTLNLLLESAIMFLRDCAVTAEEEDEPDPVAVPRAVLVECQETLAALGPWACGHVAQYFAAQVSALEEQEALSSHQRLLQFCLTQLRLVSTITERAYEKDVQVLEDFMTYMTPKVLQVINILHNYKPDDNFMIIGDETMAEMDDGEETDDSLDLSDHEFAEPEPEKKKKDDGQKAQVHYVAVKKPDLHPKADDESLCGVIFVARAHTAFALNKLIQEVCNWEPDLFFIKSSHLTGHGFAGRAARSHQSEMQCRKQEEILRKFRNKELNLLVATPEVEEGVDMPRCNMVMRFELPQNYRSYVQSKGRARARLAHYYMLVEESKNDCFMDEFKTYKGIERILMRKCENTDEFRSGVPKGVELPLPPYQPVPDEDSAQVSMETAIALVNRYCAKLPSDAFTHLTAKCTVKEQCGDDGSTLYQACLQLPINSPIKEPIEGEVMPSRQMAKMAVALKTCEILHKNGELDDGLQPVGKEVIKYEDEEGEWEDHELAGQARPGTTKRKQYYSKKIAHPLLGTPASDSPCYVYEIHMSLTCSITEEQNTRGRQIHAPEDTPRCFAIISRETIPLVPNFPVFTRSGEVTVSIEMVTSGLTLTSAEIERLQEFHHVVFKRVLRLEKDPMLFCPGSAHSSYIIAPLTTDDAGSRVIDWPFVKHVESSPLPTKRPELYCNERPKFEFGEAVFEDAVVMPSYRNMDQPQYFYVAEIRHDLTPRSPFPSPEVYSTFEQYYTAKYGLKITNLDQPLLDVDHTSARLNLLTPRYMNQKGVALPTSSAETRRQRRENLQQKQILVPELCDVHPFPASLWRKAVCLPAILYRTNCLLIAEELREKIAIGAQVGQVELPEGFRFDELEFGFSTKPGDGELPNAGNTQEQDIALVETTESNPEDVIKAQPSVGLDDKASHNEQETEARHNTVSGVSNEDNKEESNVKSPTKNQESSQNEEVSKPLPCQPDVHQPNHCEQDLSEPEIEDLPEPCENEPMENLKNTSKTKSGLDKEEIVIVMDQKHKDIPVAMTNGVTSDSEATDKSSDKWAIDLAALGMDNMLGGLTISDQKQDGTVFGEDSNWNDWQPETGQDNNHAKPEMGLNDQMEPETRKQNHGAPTDCSKETLSDNSNGLVGANLTKIKYNQDQKADYSGPPSGKQPTVPNNIDISTSEHSSGSNSTPSCSSTSSRQGTSVNVAVASCSRCHGNTTTHGSVPCSCSSHTSSSQCHVESNCDNLSCLVYSPPSRPSPDLNGSCNHDNERPPAVPCDAPVHDSSSACAGCRISAESGVQTALPAVAPSTSCCGNRPSAISSHGGCTTQSHSDLSGICKKHSDGCAHGDITETASLPSHSDNAVAVFTPDSCDCGSSLCVKCEYQRKIAVAERSNEEVQQDCTPLITFESEVNLLTFIGPTPCLLLQALTMSNANDFFNLERLETIGDSFLKFAITVYLYCTYPGIHEGKLSYLRSKQVSNYNLYRLGKRCKLPELMVAAKFEPAENWLPPGFVIKKNNAYCGLESLWTEHGDAASGEAGSGAEGDMEESPDKEEEEASQEVVQFNRELAAVISSDDDTVTPDDGEDSRLQGLIPYKLQTQHSLPDKSIADCVEALIGCYLTTCGSRAALQFMSWLGLKVLPEQRNSEDTEGGEACRYGQLNPPCSPLLTHLPSAAQKMEQQLHGYTTFEKRIGYQFNDRAYLMQAFTHASYHYNHSTDCYQRLEFLGDAILDYVITRHLFEDSRKHSPGILTDLRSALVNNNIFAALAVKWDFHKYFKAVSPQLFHVIDKFVSWQKERNDEINLDEEFEDLDEDQDHSGEDIEIPKALGDIFESVAGAIYLDSGMSLDTVWHVYYRLMKPQIDTFTERIPKSPVRELLEMEPETAKFEKPERTLDGKIRVTVNVVDKGQFKGVGRNYRIAKSAAARRALKYIRMVQQMAEQQQSSQPGYHLPFLDGVLCGQRPPGPSGGVAFIDWGSS